MTDTLLDLDTIRIDGGTQLRAQLSEATVEEYAEDVDALPPATVFFDGSESWLADGFHRYHAHRKADRAKMLCRIINGTRRDAILHAVGANAAHGLRRSNADKRRAVLALINDEQWAKKSDRWIATKCGVSHPFVGDLRPKEVVTVTTPEPEPTPALAPEVDAEPDDTLLSYPDPIEEPEQDPVEPEAEPEAADEPTPKRASKEPDPLDIAAVDAFDRAPNKLSVLQACIDSLSASSRAVVADWFQE